VRAPAAQIYAELVGYGANSDGYDMVAPSGVGGEACMKIALEMANKSAQGGRKVDYINTHGTSTPVGDAMELAAVKRTFVDGSQFNIQFTCFTNTRAWSEMLLSSAPSLTVLSLLVSLPFSLLALLVQDSMERDAVKRTFVDSAQLATQFACVTSTQIQILTPEELLFLQASATPLNLFATTQTTMLLNLYAINSML
jgi:hypothetical protein